MLTVPALNCASVSMDMLTGRTLVCMYIKKDPPYMLQLEVISKKTGNEFGSRLGRETMRRNMFGSIFRDGSFLVAGVVFWQHESHFC